MTGLLVSVRNATEAAEWLLPAAADLARARRPGKLAVKQGNELVLGTQSPAPPVRPMLPDQTSPGTCFNKS